jgi:hypothetical protein
VIDDEALGLSPVKCISAFTNGGRDCRSHGFSGSLRKLFGQTMRLRVLMFKLMGLCRRAPRMQLLFNRLAELDVAL